MIANIERKQSQAGLDFVHISLQTEIPQKMERVIRNNSLQRYWTSLAREDKMLSAEYLPKRLQIFNLFLLLLFQI